MAELADAADLKSVDFGRVGSSPTTPTIDCSRLVPDGCGSLLHGASERASPGSRDALVARGSTRAKAPLRAKIFDELMQFHGAIREITKWTQKITRITD